MAATDDETKNGLSVDSSCETMGDERTPLLLQQQSPGPKSMVKGRQYSDSSDRLITETTTAPAVNCAYSAGNQLLDNSAGNSSEISKLEGSQHCHRDQLGAVQVDYRARRQLIVASIVCLAFMIGEFVGGILANSLAIATDAAHLLTDFASFLISLTSLYLAARPATKRMSFGWYRAEVMGALLSVLLIWVVTGVLVYMAVQRVISQEFEIDATVMLITAGVSVFFNVVMGFLLHDHGHAHGGIGASSQHNHSHFGSHGHQPANDHGQRHVNDHSHQPANDNSHSHSNDHSHSHANDHSHSHANDHSHSHANDHSHRHASTGSEHVGITPVEARQHSHSPDVLADPDAVHIRLTEREMSDEGNADTSNSRNINVRAAFIHVVGDLFQSFGVLIAAYVIYYKPEWKLADPICTFLFSILVLCTTFTIMKDILNVLMEGAPHGVSFNAAKDCLRGIKGVREVHNLRLWSLTVNKIALSAHLALDNSVSSREVLKVASQLMRDRFGIHECTIQTEDYMDEMNDCIHCRDPAD